jgi:putative ATPase
MINSHLDSNCSSLGSSTSSQELKIVKEEPSVDASSLKRTGSVSTLKRRSPEPSSSASTSTVPEPVAGPSSRKRFKSSVALESAKPLAERVRPHTLDEFVGQDHLLSKNGLLRSMIERDQVGSMVLWGPPGTGKTTLARVIGKGFPHCSNRAVSSKLILINRSQYDQERLSRDQCD